MPNPKTGTVTVDVARAVQGSRKAGKVEIPRGQDRHHPLRRSRKVSFDAGTALAENAHALISSVVKAKPATAKGTYVKSIVISSTMGPGFPIDLNSFEAA